MMNAHATPIAEVVAPGDVPTRTLGSGAKMPAIGLGTFGSDHVTGEQVAVAVLDAAAAGYRHFDCASVYGNEPHIGHSFARLLEDGLPRQELWVTSKVWNDRHHDVAGSCEQSLRDLQLDYLDLYLVHWPFPNFHPPHCDVTARSPGAKPYIHADYMNTWRQMETLVDRGLVRHIGTSNMTIPKLELLLRDARIKPAANEMELHPHFQQPALFDFVTSRGIVPIGYSPLGSPGRPQRDRTADDTVDVEDPVVVSIARQRQVHPASICLQWAVQRGQVPIPFSVTPRNYRANLQAAVAAVTNPLTPEQMSQLAAVDKNCRLIKGQVFLWKADQSWEDLWDVNGTITPA